MSAASSTDPFNCSGKTTDGKQYDSITSMWADELHKDDSEDDEEDNRSSDVEMNDEWYRKSEAYWAEQKASVAGMLGGLDVLHTRDVNASRRFLNSLSSDSRQINRRRALDVGAGIGRVTRYLLSGEFQVVDMLEQSVSYLKESHNYLESVKDKVGRRIACGMQEFKSGGLVARDGIETGNLRMVYDVIWIQWTIGYLTDDDFVAFIQQCMECLSEQGIIIIKDNVARAGFLLDKDDSSIMRSNRYLVHLLKKAGVTVIKQTRQLDFPKSVYPVRMYAVEPSSG